MSDLAGLSTLGVRLFYGTGSSKPASTGLTELTRINSIGGLSISNEQIDASALTDYVSRYVAGRGDVDSEFTITVNLTSATQTEWETLISTYQALTGTNQMYFEVYHPSMTDAFWVIAQPPAKIPLPEIGQNELLTVEMSLVVTDFIGLDDAVVPSAG